MEKDRKEFNWSEIGKALVAKRWANHKAMTPEERREYQRIKQKEYREKKKSNN